MKKLYSFFLLASLLLVSCGTTKQLTPEEIKTITTAQIGESYDLVFSSAVSLLQSQAFLITQADKQTGLIVGSWQKDNKNAFISKILLGVATESYTSQASIFIQPLRNDLTEVKLTIYRGEVTSEWYGTEVYTESKTVTNSMVQDAEVYQNWFDALEEEVRNKKALMEGIATE